MSDSFRDELAEAGKEELDRLIGRCLDGDQGAFEELVERKRAQVFRTARQQLGNAEDARVVAQSVFVRLWRNLHRFDRSRRFDTWLYQVTVNAAIDHHRRNRKHAAETALEDAAEPVASSTAGPRRSPEAAASLAEVQGILDELADLLTEKQRTAFVLREIEGLTTGEVAEVLESSESTVRNHVFQARKILREALVERYPEYAPAGTRAGSSQRERTGPDGNR